MHSKRLERVLLNLKQEFFEVGEQWKNNRKSPQLDELHAIVGAINEIELFLYNKRITTLLDIL